MRDGRRTTAKPVTRWNRPVPLNTDLTGCLHLRGVASIARRRAADMERTHAQETLDAGGPRARHGFERVDGGRRRLPGRRVPVLQRRRPVGRRTDRGLQSEFGLQPTRSEEHTSELQSLKRNSYAVFCLKKKKKHGGHSTPGLTKT